MLQIDHIKHVLERRNRHLAIDQTDVDPGRQTPVAKPRSRSQLRKSMDAVRRQPGRQHAIEGSFSLID